MDNESTQDSGLSLIGCDAAERLVAAVKGLDTDTGSGEVDNDFGRSLADVTHIALGLVAEPATTTLAAIRAANRSRGVTSATIDQFVEPSSLELAIRLLNELRNCLEIAKEHENSCGVIENIRRLPRFDLLELERLRSEVTHELDLVGTGTGSISGNREQTRNSSDGLDATSLAATAQTGGSQKVSANKLRFVYVLNENNDDWLKLAKALNLEAIKPLEEQDSDNAVALDCFGGNEAKAKSVLSALKRKEKALEGNPTHPKFKE